MKKTKLDIQKYLDIRSKNSVQNKVTKGLFCFSGEDIPTEITATNSTINISPRHYIEEKSSLQWCYKQKAELIITKDFDDLKNEITMLEEPCGNKRANYNLVKAFTMFIYSEQITNHTLEVNFYKAEKLVASFPIIINFEGWQEVTMPYNSHMMYCTVVESFDVIKICSQDNIGTLYFDKLNPVSGLDIRAPRHKKHLPLNRYSPARRLYNHSNFASDWANIPLMPLGEELAQCEIDKITNNYMLRFAKVYQPNESDVLALQNRFELFNIKEIEGCITGIFLNNKTSGEINEFCADVAAAYVMCNNPIHKEILLNMGTLAVAHSTDQCYYVDWYNGRGLATAVLVFKQKLIAKGIFNKALRFLRDGYVFERLYDLTTNEGWFFTEKEDTDTIGTCIPFYIAIILCHDDKKEMMRDFLYFKQYIEKRVLQASPSIDGYLPDGTSAHHANFLPGYHMTSADGMSAVIAVLCGTKFEISESAFSFYKTLLLTESYWRSGYYQSLSLSHIKMNTETALRCDYVGVAALYAPKGIDEDLASLYLGCALYDDEEQKSEIYRQLSIKGYTPFVRTNGHKTLSSTAQAVHKNNGKTVYLKGHSRYIFGMETWFTQGNAFPYFKSFGFTEICQNSYLCEEYANNGIAENDGFDWRRFAGTTTAILPYDELKCVVFNNKGETGETLRSDQTFVGGVSDGINGIYALKLHGHPKYGLDDFYATKTYFCYEDKILCMGSGIELFNDKYDVNTTVFQNYTDRDNIIKGENFVLDSRGTGYYIYPEQELITNIGMQTAPDSGDLSVASGNYEICYINHGKAPQNAKYAYVICLNSDAEKINFFAKQMHKAPKIIIHRQDDICHGAAFNNCIDMLSIFRRSYAIDIGIIQGVNTPCNLMVNYSDKNNIIVHIADPDLRFYEGENDDKDEFSNRVEKSNYELLWRTSASKASTVYVKLKGKFKEIKFTNGGNILFEAEDYTIIETICKNGLTNQIILRA